MAKIGLEFGFKSNPIVRNEVSVYMRISMTHPYLACNNRHVYHFSGNRYHSNNIHKAVIDVIYSFYLFINQKDFLLEFGKRLLISIIHISKFTKRKAEVFINIHMMRHLASKGNIYRKIYSSSLSQLLKLASYPIAF